jgi:TatD family-associated radical SAM protein
MGLVNLEKIAHVVAPSGKLAFSSKRIAVNFVPEGKCTNRCIFCAPNISAMRRVRNGEVLLDKEYSVAQMVRAVVNAYKQSPDCSEITITGTIGEPLLYFGKLLKFIPAVKSKTSLPVRLNTNGQSSIILPEHSSQKVCQLLEKAGLDSVAISINATNERDYNLLCRPKQQHAFDSVLDFVRASNRSGIETYACFVDYSKTPTDFPRINRRSIQDFCKTLGLKESQIVYRPMIE